VDRWHPIGVSSLWHMKGAGAGKSLQVFNRFRQRLCVEAISLLQLRLSKIRSGVERRFPGT